MENRPTDILETFTENAKVLTLNGDSLMQYQYYCKKCANIQQIFARWRRPCSRYAFHVYISVHACRIVFCGHLMK